MSSCATSCLFDVNLFDVSLRDDNLCDVKLCDVSPFVNLVDVNLRDVNLRDVNLFDVTLCGVNLCDVNLCDVNLCDVNLCDVKLHASKTSTHNFRISAWHSYPECNLHAARRQTRMAGTRQRKIFASPHGTATPNAIYTHTARRQTRRAGTHQNVRISTRHSYPERNLHTARRQTRMAGTHQRRIFAPLAQQPRTQFTHSKAPNPNARKTTTQNFRISAWHSYPGRNLHTARRQTRMAGTHQCKILASPHGTATPNTIYTQQGAKPRQTRMPGRHQHKIFASPHGTETRTQFTQSNARITMPGSWKTGFGDWQGLTNSHFQQTPVYEGTLPTKDISLERGKWMRMVQWYGSTVFPTFFVEHSGPIPKSADFERIWRPNNHQVELSTLGWYLWITLPRHLLLTPTPPLFRHNSFFGRGKVWQCVWYHQDLANLPNSCKCIFFALKQFSFGRFKNHPSIEFYKFLHHHLPWSFLSVYTTHPDITCLRY